MGVMASSNQFQDRAATLGQRLQEMRRNPFAISALASLGLHGLFFLALPFLPDSNPKAIEPEIKKSVGVVELSPDEQKRLPEFSTLPPIELPPVAEAPKLNSPDALSNLPKPSSSGFLDPSDSLLVPPLPIFIPPAPPATQIPSFSIRIPTTPASPTAPASPQPSSSPTTAESPTPSPSGSPASPAPSVAVEPGPEQPDAVAQQPSPSPRTQEQIRQDLVARQQELRQLYTYNPSGTSVNDANLAYGDWYREVFGRDLAEGDVKPKQEKITSDYPKIACPLKQSRSSVVGVVVDADNKIVGEPKVLQSSGYRLFNEEALKAVKSYSFENSSGAQQPYLIRVEFKYSEDICPAGLSPVAPAG